jgi:hypothetical protein
MIFFEHVRSNVLPVALLQELINPLMVRFLADHWNRRTVDMIQAAGIELDIVRRAWLGIFVLAAGRAPRAAIN